jgi:hypothetical protein
MFVRGSWRKGEVWPLTTTGLDSVTAFPDHGNDGSASHICIWLMLFVVYRIGWRTLDESWEERLGGEILV